MQMTVKVFITSNKTALNYYDAGEGEILLFLHGFPQTALDWQPQLEYFAQHYHVIALDLKGFGSSQSLGVSDYRYETLILETSEFCESLKQPLHLVGNDWGGVIAWGLAKHHPQLLKSMTIINGPHPLAYLHLIKTNLKQRLKFLYTDFFRIPILPENTLKFFDKYFYWFIFKAISIHPEKFDNEHRQRFFSSFNAIIKWKNALNYYRNILNDKKSIKDYLNDGKILTPTMLLWSRRDIALEPQLGIESSKYLGQNGQLIWLENCNHWPNVEVPDIVNNYLSDFIVQKVHKSQEDNISGQ